MRLESPATGHLHELEAVTGSVIGLRQSETQLAYNGEWLFEQLRQLLGCHRLGGNKDNGLDRANYIRVHGGRRSAVRRRAERFFKDTLE
jgi:hypothetical protein